jgi:uncharacterized protein
MAYYVYKDQAGWWRWRLKSANNEIVAASSESFSTKHSCLYNIQLVKSSSGAPVYDA